ncbi:MAG: 4-hydroxybenzoate octaprenyltransferase [Verrucomicrobia bacterium]|nr:4-hydroxybenzoate octaprenyltransferase [Verrucomicrobiota bacterium]
MWQRLALWADFVKISHTVFALPFALASMMIAARTTRGWPGWKTFLLVLACMFFARSCAMAFNRIADREFDRANPRTASRHLPSGQITLASAWGFFLLNVAGFGAAAYALNPLCFLLSPVALFVVCFYSLTKRFTDFTHVFLGVALALAPLGAWIAVKGKLQFVPLQESAMIPVLLSLAVVFWLIGFDIIYAIQDYDFDRRNGLRSLVVAWGPDNALRASALSHMLMWGLLAGFGMFAGFKIAYFTGLIVILICLALEHFIARKRSLKWVQTAFFKLNALISGVFFTVVAAEIVFPGFRFAR